MFLRKSTINDIWHRKMMEQNHLYTFLNSDENIVGGAGLFGAEDLFHSKIIKLDTPIWNERTNRFYKKCGYTEIGRDGESVYYEKQMRGTHDPDTGR